MPPELVERMREIAERFERGLRLNVSPETIAEFAEMHRRYSAAKELPADHPKRKMWEMLDDKTFAWARSLAALLPSPLEQGRPKGSGKITAEMLAEMDRLVGPDKTPTAAAREIVRGRPGGTERSQADNLVKAWRKSVKK